MKFSVLALSVAASLCAVDAKRTFLNAKQLKSGNGIDKRALLNKLRKLDQDNGGDFQMTGDYSIRFNSCVAMDLETYGEDFDKEQMEMYEGATAVQELLIVDLVSSDKSVPTQEVAMTIGDFVTAIGSMVYNQVDSYCSVCQEIYETCQETKGSWKNTVSKYFDSNYGATVETVDCNTCALYNCNGENNDGDDEDEEQEYSMEDAFTYLQELSECQEFQYSYSNQEYEEYRENGRQQQNQQNQQNQQYQAGTEATYISYTCNAFGNGIDLGFFMDADCTMLKEDGNVAEHIPENSMAGKYLLMSKSLIEGIFMNSFSCQATQYVSPFAEQAEGGGYNYQFYGNNADGDEVVEANEYCQAVTEGENTVFITSCSTFSNVQTANGDDAGDEDMICQAIADAEATWTENWSNWNYEEGAEGLFDFTYYDSSSSSRWGNNNGDGQTKSSGYDYRTYGKYNEERRVYHQRTSIGTVFLWIGFAVAAVAGGAYFLVYKKQTGNEAKKQSLILEGDAGDYKAEGEIA